MLWNRPLLMAIYVWCGMDGSSTSPVQASDDTAGHAHDITDEAPSNSSPTPAGAVGSPAVVRMASAAVVRPSDVTHAATERAGSFAPMHGARCPGGVPYRHLARWRRHR